MMSLTLFMFLEFLFCLLPAVEAPHCESDLSLLAETMRLFGYVGPIGSSQESVWRKENA